MDQGVGGSVGFSGEFSKERTGTILASMDHLWTPWRYRYVTTAEHTVRAGIPQALADWAGDKGCVFCNMIAAVDHAVSHGMAPDEAESAAYLVYRGRDCFVCLNAFPYTSGHLMAIPYRHESSLAALPAETAHELMDLAQRAERVFGKLYKPHGVNIGMNLGEAAGAGVAGHLHLHALPRWTGDTNFMTTIAESRVLPEDLAITCARLRAAFAG